MTYRPYRIAAGLWYVIDENHVPVYDDALDGKDRPLVWDYHEVALGYAKELSEKTVNESGNEKPSVRKAQ